MPINYALLLCIPIGLLAYFEARWLTRFVLGRYERRERRAVLLVGVYGALIIPLIYSCGVVSDCLTGGNGTIIIMSIMFTLISALFAAPLFLVLIGRVRDDAKDH